MHRLTSGGCHSQGGNWRVDYHRRQSRDISPGDIIPPNSVRGKHWSRLVSELTMSCFPGNSKCDLPLLKLPSFLEKEEASQNKSRESKFTHRVLYAKYDYKVWVISVTSMAEITIAYFSEFIFWVGYMNNENQNTHEVKNESFLMSKTEMTASVQENKSKRTGS